MLIHRLLTAMIFIPCIICVLFFFPLRYFAAFVILICGLAVWEWTQFIGVKQQSKRLIWSVLTTLALGLLYYAFPKIWFNAVTYFSLWLALVWWVIALFLVINYPKPVSIWKVNNWFKGLCGFCTIVPFFTSMLALRSINYITNPFTGAFLLLYILILIWVTDSGAYFVGRQFGKHKLAPKVSPGKTIEGFVGGLVLALLVSLWISYCYPSPFVFSTTVLVSLVAILASTLGDLTESMFKRAANIKDSGQLIPGHGGILDRIDSLTASVPIFAALIILL